MAPKAPKAKSGSSTGLIVTLVFFILATIVLGITTYTGYSDMDQYVKKAKDSDDKAKKIEKDRDWQRFQALLYRSYMGHLNRPEDQESLRTTLGGFTAGSFPSGVPDAELTDVKQVIATLNPKVQLDPTQAKAAKSFEQQLVDLRAEILKLETQLADLTKAKNSAEANAKAAQDQQKKDKAEYETQLAATTKKAEEDKNDLLKKRDELEALVAQIGKEKEELLKRGDQEKKVLQTQVTQKNADVVALKGLVDQKEKEISQYRSQGSDAPKDWRTDWKIVRIDRGGLAYINLGSRDHVQEQLTFSVHGLDLNGKPLPSAKGTVEVLNVIGDHLSQVRVTSTKDSARDPILTGDILFNPVWSPNLRKHVAIAGIVDLTGDGRDSLEEFKRNLERQGILVDAWTDLIGNKVQGRGLTLQTDYLIRGDDPSTPLDPNDNAIKKLEDAAREKGVRTITLRRYLEMIGYRLPIGTGRPAPRLAAPAPAPGQAPGPMDPNKEPQPGKEPQNPQNPPANPPGKDKGM